jgi:hypothetical protein
MKKNSWIFPWKCGLHIKMFNFPSFHEANLQSY